MFAKQGPDASVSEIAKAAGVGQGTAFRHFPTKDDLLCAAMQDHVDSVMEFAREQLEIEDPWEALAGFCREVVQRYMTDRGFLQAVKQGRLGPYAETCKGEITDIIDELLRRAREAGVIRADIVGADINLMLTAAGDASDTDTPDAGARVLQLMLDGMRASSVSAVVD